jgi:hypothetical protein
MMARRRLRMNERILRDLKDVQSRIDSLVDPRHPRLADYLHPYADALIVYVDSWMKPVIDRAIRNIEGTADDSPSRRQWLPPVDRNVPGPGV